MYGRFILDPVPRSGIENMECDLELLHESCAGAPPTLRVYRWACPTVSMGRFQKDDTVDLDYARENGIDVVRRPTGGRGVLHDDEVTYSFTGSIDQGIPRGVEESYAYLSRALSATFLELGVHLDSDPQREREATNPTGSCYLTSTPADLCVEAAKLSGSAQVWQGRSVLQHGSIVRSRDLAREARIFMLDTPDIEKLKRATITFADIYATPPAIDAIAQSLKNCFSRALDIDFS